MTGVGIEPTQLKLPVCFVVNSMDGGRWYHVQVIKIKETIIFIGCQQNDRAGSWTHTTKVTGVLNQRLLPLGHPACMLGVQLHVCF